MPIQDTWLSAELPGSQSKTIDLLHISVMSSSRGLVLNWSKTWTHHFLLKTKITYKLEIPELDKRSLKQTSYQG